MEEKTTMTTPARVKASKNYNKKTYDTMQLYLLKGKKALYKEVAAAAGYKTLGTFIEDLMDTIAANKGYSEQVKEINGGTINRQRTKTALHESAPAAADVFAGIVKGD